MRKVNAVFEGGGIRALGLAGAAAATLDSGFEFDHVAGSSSGSIVASMFAAGYGVEEAQQLLKSFDFSAFQDANWCFKIPLIGRYLGWACKLGLYKGDQLEATLKKWLAAKGILTFGDLKDSQGRYKLHIIVADITNGRTLVFPDELPQLGLDPDAFLVSKAVRMSISIPFFFEPVTLALDSGPTHFVDGGITSNFPFWVFHKMNFLPVVGYRLEESFSKGSTINGVIQFTKSLIDTALEANDQCRLQSRCFLNTIYIPTLGIKTTQFGLGPTKKGLLFDAGYNAARNHFASNTLHPNI